jgi:hypothetical protein
MRRRSGDAVSLRHGQNGEKIEFASGKIIW